MEETMMKRDFISSLLILVGFVVTACTSADDNYRNNQYFQYYISTIRIQNPRVVLFHEQDMWYEDYPMCGFVCPDSAVKYCADRNWKDREDVFLFNGRRYSEEQGLFKAYGKWFYKIKPWDVVGAPWHYLESFNDTIQVGHFYYDEDLSFILSMHTTAYWTWDAHSPGGDLTDTAEYAKTFRLAVRPKYSIWQTYKINKLQDTCYEAIEYTDTILFVPTKCTEEDDD